MSDKPRQDTSCPICGCKETEIILADGAFMLRCIGCLSDTARWPLIDANAMINRQAKLTPSPDVAGLVANLETAHANWCACVDSDGAPIETAFRDNSYFYGNLYGKAAYSLASLSAQLKEQEAECAGLREDAERYRFLAECDLFGIHYEYGEAQRWLDSRTELDAAIDARKESK